MYLWWSNYMEVPIIDGDKNETKISSGLKEYIHASCSYKSYGPLIRSFTWYIYREMISAL
jgi:hypothetical protein